MAQATFSVVNATAPSASVDPLPADVAEIETELTTLMRMNYAAKMPLPGAPGRVLERSSYQMLTTLLDDGPARGSDLAAALGLDLSTVSRQVSTLCELGFVERHADPADGRASRLTLTRSGAELVTECRRLRRIKLMRLLEDWSAPDRADFGRLLGLLNTGMRALAVETAALTATALTSMTDPAGEAR